MAEVNQYHNKGGFKQTLQETSSAYLHSSTTSSGKFIFDSNGIIIDIGSQGAELVGCHEENLLGHPLGEFIEGNDKDTFYTHYRKVFDTGVPQTCSVKMMHRLGMSFHVKLESTPVTDSTGNQLCRTQVTDISGRKRIAEEMLEKEIEFKKAQRIAGLGSFRVNFKTGVQDWSDQLFSLLGVEVGEVSTTYVSYMEFVHPDDRDRMNYESRETLNGHQNLDIEYRIIRKDGETRHFHTQAELDFDTDGSPLWIYGFSQDITERKQAEVDIKHKNNELMTFINSITDLAWFKDINSNFVVVNKAFGNAVGMNPEYLANNTCEICFGKEAAEQFKKDDAKVLESRKQIVFEESIVDCDGNKIWLETIKTPIFDESGEASGTIGVARNINDRKKFEDDINKFKFFSDNSNDAHFLIGKDAKFQYANKTACRMFGYSEDEFLTLSVPDVDDVYDVSKCRELFDLIQLEPVPPFETINRRKDGTVFPSEITVTGYHIEGINYTFAALRDTTERKKDLEKAFRVNQLAAIGELAAGVAHEVNNPINGIINYAQILENRSEPLSREWDICNRIIKEGDRIAYIVSSLLSFARESSEEKTSTNICDIITSTLDLINTPLRKDNIRVDVRMSSHAIIVSGKPEQIRQVFLNIISNARYALNHKYPSGNDNKILAINCEERSDNGCSIIQIVFHDMGTGIPEGILNKVVNPFFTSKPGQEGTGLGLSISQSIVSEHGGALSIQSVEGEFTKVIVELPVEVN